MKFLLDSLLLLPLLLICWLEALVKLFIPKKRKSVTGEIVLVTGAGHGIGKLTAYEFAKLKCKLVLWDINKVTALSVFSFLVPLTYGHGYISVKKVEINYSCHFTRRGV
jgi:hypothetical protein